MFESWPWFTYWGALYNKHSELIVKKGEKATGHYTDEPGKKGRATVQEYSIGCETKGPPAKATELRFRYALFLWG